MVVLFQRAVIRRLLQGLVKRRKGLLGYDFGNHIALKPDKTGSWT
jgi:hypothetical protein